MKNNPTNCFVGLFDILGFSDLVAKGQLNRVLNTYLGIRAEMSRMRKAVSGVLDSKTAIRMQLFSDTFLIYSDDVSEERLTALLAICDGLFISAVKNRLCIRGSITVGELIVSGRAVIGKPIVEAHKQEGLQDWMGCIVTDDCVNSVSQKELDKFIADCTILEYEIPLKSGKVSKQHAFNWIKSIEWALRFKNRGKAVTKEQLMKATSFLDEDPDCWDARRKILNTRQFREYAIEITLLQAALDMGR